MEPLLAEVRTILRQNIHRSHCRGNRRHGGNAHTSTAAVGAESDAERSTLPED